MSQTAQERPTGPLPAWFAPLERVAREATATQISRFTPPPGHLRRSAVLILFARDGDALLDGHDHPDGPAPDPEAAAGPDRVQVLLTERAARLRSHAGQVAFPGGRQDPQDAGPEAAALREAQEETGLDPAGVQVIGCLPDLYLPPSDYAVTPVLGWWRIPSPVFVVDPGEVARVETVAVSELIDPANRFLVSHPSGFVGPGFMVGDLFVWGFTAGILDRVLHLSGWGLPWDTTQVRPVPSVASEPAPGALERHGRRAAGE